MSRSPNSLPSFDRADSIPVIGAPSSSQAASSKQKGEYGFAALWMGQKKWVLLRSLCALIWALELFWIQSFAFEASPGTRHPILYQLGRFGFDFVFALTFLLVLRRRYLLPLMILNVVLLSILGAYAHFFHRPLMPADIMQRWREGMIMGFDFRVFPWKLSALVLLAVVKGILLIKSGAFSIHPRLRWRIILLAVVIYTLPVIALQSTYFRLSSKGGMRRAVYAYGHALPWVVDTVGWLDTEKYAERAKPYLAANYDRITPLETPLTIKSHVIGLQLETIGTAAIDAQYKGEYMMPFLHALCEKSMFFRLESFHRNGSCDMDYAASAHAEPCPGIVPAMLRGVNYTNSTPQFLKKHGFKSYVFHGNSGHFYQRLSLMEQLGFDHLFFREQLADRRLQSSLNGVRDAALLDCIPPIIQSENRAYVFAITLDTHFPFDFLIPSEMEIFPQPANAAERYLNSIRYLDRCLEKLFRDLPDGVTAFIYGDHTASLKTDIFVSDIEGGKEYVGCLIYQKGKDLSNFQQTRNKPIAIDGGLNLLDVMSYLRHSIAYSSDSTRDVAEEKSGNNASPQ